MADGLRDVRAIATDTAGYTRTSATVASRRVDNTVPTVSLADPGAYLTGTKTLTATASDAGSGLAGLQHRLPPGRRQLDHALLAARRRLARARSTRRR